MAAVKTQSVLAKKYGAKLDSAVKTHANEKTITQSNIDLPGGIRNGILQVTKCYFKEYGKDTTQKTADGKSAAGEYYFRCEGTVQSPKSVDTENGPMPILGLPVPALMIPFCDTKDSKGIVTTQEQHLEHICKVMRSLGGEEYTQGATINDLESLAAGLEQANPYCWFSTTQTKPTEQYPNPRVFTNWHSGKGLENYTPENVAASAIKDNTTVGMNNGQKVEKVTERQVPDNTVKVEESEYASWELDQLLELANSEADSNVNGREELERRAVEQGWTDEEVKNAISWEAVVEMIEKPKGSEENTETAEVTSSPEVEPEPEITPPKTNSTWKYTPPGNDPSSKKPYKERSCQVIKVDKDKKTVVLKDLAIKGKEWKDVAWDKLS